MEAALQRVVDSWEGLPPGVRGAMEHALMSGGKRLRPILCAAAYRAGGGRAPPSDTYDMAVSLELIHAYSLAHDDLPCMDDASLRRGAATTHRVHGVPAATRAGAALIPWAAAQAITGARRLACPEPRAREIARVLCRASGAGGMVGGQALDLLAEGAAAPSVSLERLHRLKTGALLTAALEMGALAAGAEGPAKDALVEYGQAVGLAFQIADDILDASSTTAELGKEPSDAHHAKVTFVSTYGLERARELGEAQVERARAALRRGGLDAPVLDGLAAFVIRRRH